MSIHIQTTQITVPRSVGSEQYILLYTGCRLQGAHFRTVACTRPCTLHTAAYTLYPAPCILHTVAMATLFLGMPWPEYLLATLIFGPKIWNFNIWNSAVRWKLKQATSNSHNGFESHSEVFWKLIFQKISPSARPGTDVNSPESHTVK